MREWKKKVATVGLSASLLAGVALAPVNALAEPLSTKGLVNKYTAASIDMNQPWLQQKIDEAKQSPFSEDTLVIRYQKPLTVADHQRMGATLVKQISELNYAVVKVQDKKKLHNVISNYQKLNSVVSVSPSVLYKSYGMADPKVGEQYHLSQLQIEKAQKLAGSHKVKVAVIDTGMDSKHPELKGQLLPSFNTVSPINPGLPDSHGTHVAGIIAGKKDNGIGGYGINPNATIIPIDVFDRGWGATDYAIAQGILQAIKSGAQVINMSLGGPFTSPLIEDAVKQAVEKNIVVVAAAGNEGSDWTNYPAGYEGVISVGSTNAKKELSTYSSFGTSVDVVAPGEEVYSSIYEIEKLSSFRKMSGTSMASPVVAGVASLLLTKHPNLTPAQVEYILEHTAKDLGDPGYDVKFANGLIDPVAALNFDINKLPKSTLKPLTEKEILAQAKQINPNKQAVLETESITAPYEEHWVQFTVEEGQSIQAVLNASRLYDYKMMIHFYSKDGKYMENVNEVREGKAEGKLIKAPFSGTVAIGVKDVNGSYDDSDKKLSQYTLSIEKLTELPKDESTLEAPIEVKELPFQSKEIPMTFTGEEGDDDYLKFSVKEKQVIKINTSAVPGVNSSISVYTADMLVPPAQPEEGKVTAAHEVPKEEIYPMFSANSKGISEGEVLTFVAEPEIPYVIKVSNKPTNFYNYYGMFDPYMGMSEPAKAEASVIPYSVNIDGKVLPTDEDNYPMMGEMPGQETKEIKTETIINKLNTYKAAHDPWFDEYFTKIKEAARPHAISDASNGYLQFMGDEDWFTVTPTATGIYEFNFTNSTDLPMMEVYQLKKQKDDKGEEYSNLNIIGSNMNYGWSAPEMTQKLLTGLLAGETYYVKVSTSWFDNKISFDPYNFTSNLLIENPGDKYEDNNETENVKDIPGLVFEGNFAMPNDQDVFYFQSKSEQVYGVKIERGKLDEKLNKLPKEIISPFYGYMTIFEDTNNNRKLDISENNSVQMIQKGGLNGVTFGSFKAEKGKNYIITVAGYTESIVPLTLMPYKVSIGAVDAKDEDAGNKVVNNKPSKPIALKKINKQLWESAGNFNAGIDFGDEDWYTLTLDKNASGTIKLETSLEIDGQIELYQDGKLISSADFYPAGDAEVMSVSLKKGTYHVKVKDFFGNATITPYKLKVYMN
ncbi:S8 family serine peptidase [Bacillus sp. CGMCC 1.16607]|uniref:S8 family peptidase n=1 Tax=Bacillus sp. CGMCC 1.16607 TaxID=3351842 RepID=UPI00363D5A27